METETISQLFSACDKDSKGFLDRQEFYDLCTDHNWGGSQLEDLFNSLDINNDGKIEKREFVERFQTIAEALVDSDIESQERTEQSFVRTSTPQPYTRMYTKSWETFLDEFGHVIFGLASYEKIQEFHQLIDENPSIFKKFQQMLTSLFKDIANMQESITEYETSLTRVNKQHEDQLKILEEEMETQMKTREEKVRLEEKDKYEGESVKEQEKYEKQIAQLQDAVNKLKQVDNKLSGISSYTSEVEKLREKVRQITAENSHLQTKLNEAETNIAVLRSEITALNIELHEKTFEQDRQNDAVTMAISEHENMSRQVSSLYSENRRLRDSNDDLRVTLDSNLANFRRISTRLSKSPNASFAGDVSPRSLSRFDVGSINSGVLQRSSYLDIQALAECDPVLKTRSASVDDDDTEMEISMRSSLDGTSTMQTNSVFERDSGVGTLREDFESDIETLSRHGGRTHLRRPVFSPFPPTRSIRNNSNSSRRHRLKEKRTSVDRFTDLDGSDEISDSKPVNEGRTSKLTKKRKVVNPDIIPVTGPLYKIILCGDVNVGKSSFVLRFCQNEFRTHTRSTLGVDFRVKNVRLSDSEAVTVQLWDTAGQERFRSIASSYFRKADGVILLYDVTSPSSFISVRDWMERITDSVAEGTPVLICGNKIDLRNNVESEDCVEAKEGAQLAANYGVLFMETSAASGSNIQSGVTLLARHLATNKKETKSSETITELNKSVKKLSCCQQSG